MVELSLSVCVEGRGCRYPHPTPSVYGPEEYSIVPRFGMTSGGGGAGGWQVGAGGGWCRSTSTQHRHFPEASY